jgi:hypothetical protein
MSDRLIVYESTIATRSLALSSHPDRLAIMFHRRPLPDTVSYVPHMTASTGNDTLPALDLRRSQHVYPQQQQYQQHHSRRRRRRGRRRWDEKDMHDMTDDMRDDAAMALDRRSQRPSDRLPRISVFNAIHDHSGFFVSGRLPRWIFIDERYGSIYGHPMWCDGAVTCFASFDSDHARRGFAYVTDKVGLFCCMPICEPS